MGGTSSHESENNELNNIDWPRLKFTPNRALSEAPEIQFSVPDVEHTQMQTRTDPKSSPQLPVSTLQTGSTQPSMCQGGPSPQTNIMPPESQNLNEADAVPQPTTTGSLQTQTPPAKPSGIKFLTLQKATTTILPPKKKSRKKRNGNSNNCSYPVSPNPGSISTQSNGSSKTKLDALKRLLECPICFEMPTTSMFLCSNGHSICGTCRGKLEKCPICQGEISETKNILFEQIRETFLVKCDNASEGCLVKISEMEKAKHAMECHFRPMECNFIGCYAPKEKRGVQVKYRRYIKHILHVHGFDFVKDNIAKFRQYCSSKEDLELSEDHPWNESLPVVIESFGTFFLTATAVTIGKMFWWTYVFGDEKAAESYRTTISITNRSAGIEMSWTGPVHNIRMEPTAIQKSGLCLTLFKENLIPFTYARPVADGDNTALEEKAWDMVFIVEKKGEKLDPSESHALSVD